MEFQFLNIIVRAFRKMSLRTVFSVLILAFLAASCMERIDISTESSPSRLVIYGYLTSDTMQHAVRVSRSSGYFSTSQPEGLSGASVSISYKGGKYLLKESPAEPGLYLTDPDVYGVEGEEYTLQVRYDYDGDGKEEIYEAGSFLPYSAVLDSTAVTHSSLSKDYLQIVIWGKLPEKSSRNYNFRLYVNHELMNDAPTGYTLFQDDYLGGKEFKGIPVFQLNQKDKKRVIKPGDTISVQIESLTAEYADFMHNVSRESGGSLPFFGGPPANVETNIHCIYPADRNDISGFFTAYSKNRISAVAEW